MMRSRKNLLVLAIVFMVFAAVFSVLFWADVSMAAKTGLFVLGFGSGFMFGGWVTRQNRLPNSQN